MPGWVSLPHTKDSTTADTPRLPLSDPLSEDPLAAPASPPQRAVTAQTSAWAQPQQPRHDLFAQPFESDRWSSSTSPQDHTQRDTRQQKDSEGDSLDRKDSADAAKPSTSASSPAPPPPKDPKLNAEATPFTSPSAASSAPISMTRTASSLHRARSPSTSGLKEGQEGRPNGHPLEYSASVTPRSGPSPFAHYSSSETSTSPDLSSTPSATSRHRPSHSKETKTVTGSVGAHGYDPSVLKTLIAGACSSGDLDRLQALLNAGDGSDDSPSVFALANRPLTSSALTPLHIAAGRGHLEVSRTLSYNSRQSLTLGVAGRRMARQGRWIHDRTRG